jgi:hypothetical protein
MKRIVLTLLLAVASLAHGQTATQTQQGAQFIIAPDSNGIPQIVGYKLWVDPSFSPFHVAIQGTPLNVWGPNLNRANKGWNIQTLTTPLKLTPGANYELDVSGNIHAPAQTTPPPKPVVSDTIAPGLSKYLLVFDDEFNAGNTSEIENSFFTQPTTKWVDQMPPPNGGSLGTGYNGPYTNPPNTTFRTSNMLETSPSGLDLNAWYEPTWHGTGHWLDGLICSMDAYKNGFSQRYGYWEIAMQVAPLLPGDAPNTVGLWESFWLVGDNGINALGSPTNPVSEIDIVESYSSDYTKFHQNVHNYVPGDTNPLQFTYSAGVDISQAVHTYSCLVNPDFIHFYFDGIETSKVATPVSATYPMHMLIDGALGGGYSLTGLSTTGVYPTHIVSVRCWANPAN